MVTGMRVNGVDSIRMQRPAMATANVAVSLRHGLLTSLRTMARQVNAQASALVMTQPGEPVNVLALKELDVIEPTAGQICVEILAAPINPRCGFIVMRAQTEHVSFVHLDCTLGLPE